VTTTDFFTLCCKNRRHEFVRACGWLMCALLFVLIGQTSGAIASEATAAESAELRVDRTTDGVFLSTSLQFALPELAEDALYKGIPMFFVAEAQVLRHRWYWSDKQVAQATRYLRLSYQPLTRRWRLNTSTVPFANSGLGVVLGQNFDDYNDAMAAVQRIARWKIADASAMESDALHTVNLRFRLDMSQLPRPFQIGAVGQSGWNVLVSRSQRLMPEPAK